MPCGNIPRPRRSAESPRSRSPRSRPRRNVRSRRRPPSPAAPRTRQPPGTAASDGRPRPATLCRSPPHARSADPSAGRALAVRTRSSRCHAGGRDRAAGNGRPPPDGCSPRPSRHRPSCRCSRLAAAARPPRESRRPAHAGRSFRAPACSSRRRSRRSCRSAPSPSPTPSPRPRAPRSRDVRPRPGNPGSSTGRTACRAGQTRRTAPDSGFRPAGTWA